MKDDRIDDDAEDECNKEVLCDCFFPQCIVSLGTSPIRRRTQCEVRRDSCDKVHIVFTEVDDIHVLCAIVSFKTARRRVVQTSSRVMCDSCGRSVSLFQGCLFSDCGQSQFKREQFICAGCLTLTGIERWESRECNKPGHLRTDCCVYKKRIAERGNNTESVETTAVVQGVMVETLEYEDGMLIESRFSYVSELTTRGTALALSPISGSSLNSVGTRKYTGQNVDSIRWSSQIGWFLS